MQFYANKAIAISVVGDTCMAIKLHDLAIEIYERLVKHDLRSDLAGRLTAALDHRAACLLKLSEKEHGTKSGDSPVEVMQHGDFLTTKQGHVLSRFERCKASAEHGDAKSQFNLGLIYAEGVEIEQNFENAAHWYKNAAVQGHSDAQNNLASLLFYGRGIEKDVGNAIRWFRNAAEQGNRFAQYNLASRYRTGDGIDKDVAKAEYWMRASAEAGFVEAQFSLAGMYEAGQGVAENEATAVEWYRKASEQGHKDAQCRLALLLLLETEATF